MVGVYVDNLVVTGIPKKEIDNFKSQVEKQFEMGDLGLLAYYQTWYVNKILKEANLLDCNET
jgi:hypothetical protein